MSFSLPLYLAASLVSFIVLLIICVGRIRRGAAKGQIFATLPLLALAGGLASGITGGEIRSHGVDIPWYVFGFVSGVLQYVALATVVHFFRRRG